MTDDVSQDKPQHPTRERIDRCYELYCKYSEEKRVGLLQITLHPGSRRRLSEDSPEMTKDEFIKALLGMTSNQRLGFLHRIEIGYEEAKQEFKESEKFRMLKDTILRRRDSPPFFEL